MKFTKGQTVTLTSDLLHVRDIFVGSQVSTPQTTVQLKAGSQLVVNETADFGDTPGSGANLECVRNGGYYYIHPSQLA